MAINHKKLSVCLSLAAFNLIIGAIVSFFKLPIYLDSIGIVTSTVLLGWRYGIVCSLVTVSAGFFLINPYLPFYTLTSLGIVTISHFARKFNFFSQPVKIIIVGLVLAVVAAILSAPITTYLFEGSTLSGSDAITACFISVGKNIFSSVLLSGFSSEPVDKIIVALISFFILKSLPKSFVEKNDFRYYKD